MERYKLEIVNDNGDRYIRCEPAPEGSWVMFKDVAALEARADRNAAGYARVDAEARRAEFLHKQKIAAMQKRVRKLEYLVQCLLDEDPNNLAADGGVTVLDVWRKEARAALAGGKDE